MFTLSDAAVLNSSGGRFRGSWQDCGCSIRTESSDWSSVVTAQPHSRVSSLKEEFLNNSLKKNFSYVPRDPSYVLVTTSVNSLTMTQRGFPSMVIASSKVKSRSVLNVKL